MPSADPPGAPDGHKWAAFDAFIAEIRDETDRAAVILGTAALDARLYQLLKVVLHPSPNRDDELLDNDGPLATFSARIAMLHRLNVLAPDFVRALHLARKIRNAFAHEVSGCRLDSGSHQDRVRELFAPLRNLPIVRNARAHEFRGALGPGVDFRIALALMVGRLEIVLEESHVLGESEPWHFPPEGWSVGQEIASPQPGNA